MGLVRDVSPFHLRDLKFWGWFGWLFCFWFVWFVFVFFVCLVALFGLLPPRVRSFMSFELCANSMQSWTTVGAVMARTAWEKKNGFRNAGDSLRGGCVELFLDVTTEIPWLNKKASKTSVSLHGAMRSCRCCAMMSTYLGEGGRRSFSLCSIGRAAVVW